MAIPAWYWPPSGLTARGVDIVPFGSGFVVPDWTTPQVFPFSGGTGFGAPNVLATGALGFLAAAPDGSGGVLLGGMVGPAWHITSGGTTISGALPSGQVYLNAAYIGVTGAFLTGSGTVMNSGGTTIGTWSGGICGFTSSGTMFATLLPNDNAVGTMTSAGVTGSIALPTSVTTPSCIDMAATSGIAVGGWITAPTLSGMAASMLDPQNSMIMLAVGSGHAVQWSNSGAYNAGAYSEAWSQIQVLSGLANLNSVAWRPDGTQALATSTVSGDVQVLEYSASVLSLQQTLAVSGASSVVVAGGSVNAIVAQSGLAQLMPLTFAGSTWSVGTAVTGVTGITALAPLGLSGAVANYSGGVAILNLQAGVWSISETLNLGYAPTCVATDGFLNVYAAGSGKVSLISSGGVLLASGSWAGAAPTSMAVQQSRIVMAVPTDNLYRIFSQVTQGSPGSLVQGGQTALALGTSVGLGLSSSNLFAMGTGATALYNFSGNPFVLTSGTPYEITPVTSGVAAIYNGSSWTAAVLGIGHNPSSISFDVSGNMWVATQQNTYFKITSLGVVTTSGLITVFSGQTQSTPLGCNAITYASGKVYVATSLAGVLVEIV